MADSLVLRMWRARDKPGWRNFGVAMLVLSAALVVALFSAAVAQQGRILLAAVTTVIALGLAAWVAITIVPNLARRTSLRWVVYQVDYRLTREGMVYLGVVAILILASVNTGNNLLFMLLACSLAGILISGVLSRAVLTGIDLKFYMPEHIFAEQPVLAELELRNEKQAWPSFSLRVIGANKKGAGTSSRAPYSFLTSLTQLRPPKSGTHVPASRRLPSGRLRHPHAFPFRLLRRNAPCRSGSRDRRVIPPSRPPTISTKYCRC